MEITKPCAILRADTLDIDVLRCLMACYTVVVEQSDNQIIIELYPIS